MAELSEFIMGAKRWRITNLIGVGMTPLASSYGSYSYQRVTVSRNTSVTLNLNSPTGKHTLLTYLFTQYSELVVTQLVMDGVTAYSGGGIELKSLSGLVNQPFKTLKLVVSSKTPSSDRFFHISWMNVEAVNV
ncbi:hypothetical protein RRJ93_003193 [Vibrio parahaemolyticus]|nr:hypothetical protein [Vibrio parahaemolyticus]ELI5425187.1 hypothetical protein [Vibrio parahaemolyticus]